MDTPDLNQLTNLTAQQKAQTPGFLAGQQGQTNDFLNRFRSTLGGQETTSAMANRIGGELGLPTLQQNATNLRNTLTNIPGTYSAATRGFDVNANQLARIVGQKSSELAPAVTTAENSLQAAQGNLNTRMGYEQADQQKQLLPFQTEQSLLSDRLARETTLYTTDNQNELNSLIQKIQAGVTLSEGEKNRANQLAMAEQSFQQQKSLNEQQAKLSAGTGNADTTYQTIGGRVKLIDNRTGKVIADLGNSAAPTSNYNPYTDPRFTSQNFGQVQATASFKADK